VTGSHPSRESLLPEFETLPRLLRANHERHGDKPALVTADASITHGALDNESKRLAARLVAAGIGPSARVGLLLPNSIDWAVTAAAAARVGAVLVPLSTLLRPPELHAQLQIAEVTHLVVAREFRGRSYLDDLEAIAPGIIDRLARRDRHPALPFLAGVWTIDAMPERGVAGASVEAFEDSIGPGDDFVILFTSGSRGTPKGTIHTHGGALRATASGLACRCIGPDDRLYIPMPFFWTGGLGGGLLSALVAGATLLTEAIPEPDRTLELLERERATLFRGWPDQAARLAAHPRFAAADLSSLGPGSLPAVLPPDMRPAPGARANLFGMTETFGPYCGSRLDLDLPPDKHGSCGRPFDGVEVRIVAPDTGAECAPGRRGEIRLRGPHVMRAICGRTREATFDADGFYPTGDLGSLDADGYLWYHGRLDDMFKVKGATVYPAEVEAALRDIDGVRQAFVTNVVDNNGADAVGAVVVAATTVDELAAAARGRLSAFKVPTRWLVTTNADDVPMSATGKVVKSGLQEMLDERGSSSAP
jgi:acyl-CoA synthetase (AMP-forming)/AMP-acid ligase II